jgi:hypothetical protein
MLTEEEKTEARIRRMLGGLAVWLVLFAAASLVLCYVVKVGAINRLYGLHHWPAGLNFLAYAVAWGCLGACVAAVRAAAKHVADGDFSLSWKWWYFSKPPLGALMGLVMLIMAKGIAGALGAKVDVMNGYGVAALAFLAGFGVERALHKLDDLAKTTFTVAAAPPAERKLAILQPVANQTIGADVPTMEVEVYVPGPPAHITATCLQCARGPVPLTKKKGGIYGGQVELCANPRITTLTLVVEALVANEALTEKAVILRELVPTPSASGLPRP